MPKEKEMPDDFMDKDFRGAKEAGIDDAEESKTEKEAETDSGDSGGYDDGSLENKVSNSVGRGAVEKIIKNSVYEKYNIDSKAMREFSRLSPTEMVGSFRDIYA